MIRILATAERLAHKSMNRRGLVSRSIEGAGLRIHVYDGAGRGPLPPVVLLHGISSVGASFAPLAVRLLPHVKRVAVPELVGHGRSTHPEKERLTPPLLLDAMTASLDAIIDEPAVLYGNSLGGAVALSYAIRRPKKVRALVLASPAGARLPDEAWKSVVGAFDVKDRKGARRFLDRLYHRPPWFLALIAHELPDVIRSRAVRDLIETATQDHSPPTDQLASLEMPILLLWGLSERLLPIEALRYFERHLPPHTVIERPYGFGHTPQAEHPSRVAERVLAFARTLPSGRGDHLALEARDEA
jgi:pimeloyl-ACP methyl ester carboxylesterase